MQPVCYLVLRNSTKKKQQFDSRSSVHHMFSAMTLLVMIVINDIDSCLCISHLELPITANACCGFPVRVDRPGLHETKLDINIWHCGGLNRWALQLLLPHELLIMIMYFLKWSNQQGVISKQNDKKNVRQSESCLTLNFLNNYYDLGM